MGYFQDNPEPRIIGDRAMIALSRILRSPWDWDRSHAPFSARLPAMNPLLATGDDELPLDLNKILPMPEKRSADVLGTYVDRYRPAHTVHFDLAVLRDGKRRLHEAYRL